MSAYPYRTTITLTPEWRDYFASWPALTVSADAYAYLRQIAPCLVVRQMTELPVHHPDYGDEPCGRIRHAGFYCRSTRNDPNPSYIWIAPRLEGWESVYVLAHELGHALDHARQHPLRTHMAPRRNNIRYRVELAAVCFAHALCFHYGWQHKEGVWKWLKSDMRYVGRYTNSWDYPSVADLVEGESNPDTLPGQQLPLL